MTERVKEHGKITGKITGMDSLRICHIYNYANQASPNLKVFLVCA
jgi:hypothetical protein